MKYQIVVVITTIWVSLSCLGVVSDFTMAIEIAPRITDREIVESLTEIKESIKRLEDGQNRILREIDKRFEAMDKRFRGYG